MLTERDVERGYAVKYDVTIEDYDDPPKVFEIIAKGYDDAMNVVTEGSEFASCNVKSVKIQGK